MLSVIIINSEIYDRYLKYAYFFNRFEDTGKTAVCVWNRNVPERADIDDIIPRLFEIIKNVPEWNAYIIDEPFDSGNYIETDFEKFTQFSINPYERAKDRVKDADNIEEVNKKYKYRPEADVLLQLTYYLGDRGVEDFKNAKNLDYKRNYDLSSKYNFKAVRPNHIFLITPRIFDSLEIHQSFLQARIEEEVRRKTDEIERSITSSDTVFMQNSEFWHRYDYPSSCRFVTFNMPDVSSVLYDDSWFMFWIAVMTLALNTYTSAELGAFKLYRLEAAISSELFEKFLNKFHTALKAASEVTEREIADEVAAIKAAMTDVTSNHPVQCAPVYVNFPEVEFDDFFVESREFGLTKDRPTPDTEVWRKHKTISGNSTHTLFKAISRGKSEAIDAMHRTFKIDLPLFKSLNLTRYDIQDITEDLKKSELDMLTLDTYASVSRAEFENSIRDTSQAVDRTLPERLTTGNFIKLLLLGAGLCFVGFIPFIVSSTAFGKESVITALVISLLSSAGVCAVAATALAVRRFKLGGRLDDYRASVIKELGIIKKNSDTQGKYLTLLLNYMEKYQMLISGNVEETHMKNLERLTVLRETYDEALAQCRSIAGLCNVKLIDAVGEHSDEHVLLIPGKKIYLYEDTSEMRISLNSSRNRLVPPFPFIDSLDITEQIIYESKEYYNVNIKSDISEDIITDIGINTRSDDKRGEAE